MCNRTRNEKKDANAKNALARRQEARRIIEDREMKKFLGIL
ncbi:hypothetical protein PODOV084v1_p0022 [Vibrio phage 340E47.2]|nr:hypothetical protein PODOV084v1_p0022 [Vibrio phage 340E47.2]QZI91927.1 hypothetical protein PODOV077v1_p0016 [Vibrio phage 5P1a]